MTEDIMAILAIIILLIIFLIIKFGYKLYDNIKRVEVLEFDRDFPEGKFINTSTGINYMFSHFNRINQVKISGYYRPHYYDILSTFDGCIILFLVYDNNNEVLLVNKNMYNAINITNFVDLNKFTIYKKVVDIY